MKISRILLVGMLLLSIRGWAAPDADPNTLTAAEKTAGWRLLFDGQSLAGWRGYKTEAPGAGWKIEEGALTRVAKAGDLATRDEFGDFELKVEWKIVEGTNSGIVYRAALGDKEPWETGPEYQILDNLKAHTNRDPIHQAAGLYDLVAPSRDVTRPVGEWNEARIVIRGWHIEHWLNGTKTIDLDLASPEMKALIAASKFKATPRFATLSRGHLVLQDHGDKVSYRNLKIRELK